MFGWHNMNPRIKELAKQAGLKVECWMINPPKPFQILGSVEDFEKFTKLIIEECAWSAAAGWLKFCDEGVSATFPVGEVIMEHFGVEE